MDLTQNDRIEVKRLLLIGQTRSRPVWQASVDQSATARRKFDVDELTIGEWPDVLHHGLRIKPIVAALSQDGFSWQCPSATTALL